MLHTFIVRYATRVVAITGIFTVITMAVQLNTGRCLKTELTPKGIVSLELAGNQEYANQIRDEWKNICNEVQPLCNGGRPQHTIEANAFTNIWWDFPFIVAYGSFLYVLVVLYGSGFSSAKGKSYTFLLCTFCVLAGVFDVIENILMLQFLRYGSENALLTSIFAWSKFALLTLTGAYLVWKGRYLQRLSRFTLKLVSSLWKGRVSVLGLLILYFALWKSDQGQDLLINLNASHWGPGTLYIILTILAAFYWYWPKYFTKEKWASSSPDVRFRSLLLGNWNPNAVPVDAAYMPRLLGLLTFLVPACGIMQALDIFEIPYLFDFLDPLAWLLLSVLFFLVMVEYHVFEKLFCATPRLYMGIIFSLLALIGALAFFNEYSPNDLGLLSTGLYAMAFIFVMVTTVRNHPDFYGFAWLSVFRRQKANTWMLSFVVVAALAFLVFNTYPYITANGPYRFMTLPVVLTGIVFYTLIFFLLMIWAKKKKINYPAFVIGVAIVMAVVSDNRYHDVKTVERKMIKLPSLQTYMHNWILSRKDSILKHSEYPVFIVNAYGGGIRAAAWTTMAVGLLDSLTEQKFQNHVLAYSGASGGTIGASVLCAVRRNHDMDHFTLPVIKNFYQNDFLTPVLIGLFGRDVWFSTLSIDSQNDRARLQDSIWTHHLQPYTDGHYSKEFSSLWYPDGKPDYKIPLLFSNTYHIESGLKGILTPVSLDSTKFESVVILNKLLKQKSVPFSTGAFLSARFPYISPAGKIDADHHFLDGGLKENSGAETSEEIFKVYTRLASMIIKDTIPKSSMHDVSKDTVKLLYGKLRFYFLSLNNSVATDDRKEKRNLVELTAPFQALYNNWVGNTMKADSSLRIRHSKAFIELRPKQVCIDDKYKPVLPLGWQISDGALTGMIMSLTEPVGDNFDAINRIKDILEVNQ